MRSPGICAIRSATGLWPFLMIGAGFRLFHFGPNMEQSRGRSGPSGAQTLECENVPNNQNGTVLAPPQQAKAEAASTKRPPPRGRNAERRPREFLTADEVER